VPDPTLSPEDVAEIEARAEAATAGPWKRLLTDNDPDFADDIVATIDSWPGNYMVVAECPQGECDLDFIANARTDVPILARSHEALRAERDKLRTDFLLRHATGYLDRHPDANEGDAHVYAARALERLGVSP
jgi:hypothetical protein